MCVNRIFRRDWLSSCPRIVLRTLYLDRITLMSDYLACGRVREAGPITGCRVRGDPLLGLEEAAETDAEHGESCAREQDQRGNARAGACRGWAAAGRVGGEFERAADHALVGDGIIYHPRRWLVLRRQGIVVQRHVAPRGPAEAHGHTVVRDVGAVLREPAEERVEGWHPARLIVRRALQVGSRKSRRARSVQDCYVGPDLRQH